MVHYGSGNPGAGLGVTDDIYVNSQQGDIWFKEAGTWTLRGANAYFIQGKGISTTIETTSPSDGNVLAYDATLFSGAGGWKATSLASLSTIPNWHSGAGAPPTEIVTKTYVSDGDANGVLYYTGTNFGAGAWTNPHTAGRVTAVRSSSGNGLGPEILVDRATNDTFTNNVENSWIAIDLGSGRSLVLNKYTMRHYASTNELIRNWKLQGTNSSVSNSVADLAAAAWTDIDVRVNDSTINGTSAFGTFTPAILPSAAYRYFRILQNGANSTPNHYLAVVELEFYGTLAGTAIGGSSMGSNGDYYRNTLNEDIYYKSGGGWSIVSYGGGGTPSPSVFINPPFL